MALLPCLLPGPNISHILSLVAERDREHITVPIPHSKGLRIPQTREDPSGRAPGWEWKDKEDRPGEERGGRERKYVEASYSTRDRKVSHGTYQRPLPMNQDWN